MNRANVALQMNSTDGVNTLDIAAHELNALALVANELAVVGEKIGSEPDGFLDEYHPVQVAMDRIKYHSQNLRAQLKIAKILLNAQLPLPYMAPLLRILIEHYQCPKQEFILYEDESQVVYNVLLAKVLYCHAYRDRYEATGLAHLYEPWLDLLWLSLTRDESSTPYDKCTIAIKTVQYYHALLRRVAIATEAVLTTAVAWLYSLWFEVVFAASSSNVLPNTLVYQSANPHPFLPLSPTKEEIRIQTAGLRHGPPFLAF